jgi:hypothetical protein
MGKSLHPSFYFIVNGQRRRLTIKGTQLINKMMLGFFLPILANFWHLLHELDEPFVFSLQVQQVFF